MVKTLRGFAITSRSYGFNTMTINNISDEPLKVKHWNNPDKSEKRIDYVLSLFQDQHWIQLGHEIDQQGNVRLVEKYNCRMP